MREHDLGVWAEETTEWLKCIDPQACFALHASSSVLHEQVNLGWLDGFLDIHEGQLDQFVRLYARGKPIDVPPRSVVPNQKHFIVSALRDGATVKIEQLEHRQPEITRICLALERRLHVRSSAKVFVTPGAHAGYAPHLDHTDVLAIQLAGRKRWTIFGRLEASPVFGMSRLMTAQEASDGGTEVQMQPGDILYVGAGVGHAAACDEQYSMHVSIGLEPYTAYDVIKHRLYELALRAPQLRCRVHGGLDEEALRSVLLAGLDHLGEHLMVADGARATTAHVRRAHESVRTAHAGSDMGAILQPCKSEDQQVRASPWRNCEIVDEGDRIRLYATSTVFGPVPLAAPSLTLPASTRSEVEAMLGARLPVSLSRLPGRIDLASRAKLAAALMKFGVIDPCV